MKYLIILLTILTGFSCTRQADIVSENISRSADEFEIFRRFVFYNGITGEYILVVEGLCSLGNDRTSTEVSITCKTGANSFKKHFLGISNNVTFFAEQLEPANNINPYQYKVIFKPLSIVPDIELRK